MQASFRRQITATTDTIAIIGTTATTGIIATTGTIADGDARVSGSTIYAVMHRAGSTAFPVRPALFLYTLALAAFSHH